MAFARLEWRIVLIYFRKLYKLFTIHDRDYNISAFHYVHNKYGKNMNLKNVN